MTLTVGLYADSYPPVVDGVGICVRNYARWLNNDHCKAYVATPSVPDCEDEDSFPVYRFSSLPISFHPPYRLGMPILDAKLRNKELATPPDLVHAHSPFSAGNAGLRLANKLNVPLVASFHSKYYDDFLQATKSESLARRGVKIVVSFYNKADAVWTVNNATANTLREYGYRGDITVIGNGTDYDCTMSASERAAAAVEVNERFGIGADEKLALFVGQIVLQKNLRKTIESVAINKARGVDYRQLIVGEGYAMEELKDKTAELGIGDRVTFAGPVKDRELLKKIYSRAQLFTFPSVYDNAPVVIREAAALSCPSVLVAGCNSSEGLTDGVNAFMCDDEVHSIADAIARAISDESALTAVGQGAKIALARQWRDVVNEVYAKYTEVVDCFERRKRNKD